MQAAGILEGRAGERRAWRFSDQHGAGGSQSAFKSLGVGGGRGIEIKEAFLPSFSEIHISALTSNFLHLILFWWQMHQR